jgi:hypothetical protein
MAWLTPQLPKWLRARQVSCPPHLIGLCDQFRAAGDWRAACTAAKITVDFSLDHAAAQYGKAEAARLAEDLHGFAPDLLRWHVPNPRVLLGFNSDITLVLSQAEGPIGKRPLLAVHAPRRGAWTLSLTTFAELKPGTWTDLPACYWQVSAAPDLATIWGDPDQAQALQAMLKAGEVTEAFEAAGLPASLGDGDTVAEGGHHQLNLGYLAVEAQRLAIRYRTKVVKILGRGHLDRLMVTYQRPGKPTAEKLPWYGPAESRDAPWISRLVSLWPELATTLPAGQTSAVGVHPLVASALTGSAGPTGQSSGDDRAGLPGGGWVWEPVRIRCGGQWHLAKVTRDGLLTEHSADALRRERLLRDLNGIMCRCAQADEAWRLGPGWLPKRLKRQRTDFFELAGRGYTGLVLSILDAGTDPQIRDGEGRSLMHYLPSLDWQLALPRLLELGLDPLAADRDGNTPAAMAVQAGEPLLTQALRQSAPMGT